MKNTKIKRQTETIQPSHRKTRDLDDAHVATFDAALTSAETHLQKLMPALPAGQTAALFSEHVMTHLSKELANIADHGHRNDDPADVPANFLIDDVRAGLIPSEETDARPNVHAHFTYREWDTVLAALRHWQQDRDRIESIGMDSSCSQGMEYAQWEIATDHGDPLCNDEIDSLCLRINCSNYGG